MKAAIGWFVGLVLSVSVSAEPLLEGRVRLESGEPIADAQVRIFDLSDRQQGAIARAMTDGTGYFALPLASLGGRALPARFALGPNYPNPFNPSTIIPYQLAAAAAVRLEVFNLLGQHIATLVDGERPAGFHTATWHAVDAAGRAMGAGVYIYRMTVGVESQTGRMVLLDGQAGVSAAGAASVWSGASSGGEGAQVYGLVVSGSGLVPYVDSSFRVESGMAPVELVVSSGPHSAGKATDDDCAFCDLFGTFNDQQEEEDDAEEETAETDSTYSERGPDLIVQSPSVSAVRLMPGQAFTLQVTVQNQGDEQAAATTLHYYRSNNAAITSDDTEVGTDEIDALDASATRVATISLTVPSTPRTYFYGACVASVSDESDTLNNCSTGGRVIVGGDETPEEEKTNSTSSGLIVQSPSASAVRLTPGQTFTLQVTVQNQGDEQAAATTLHYYRSNNATITSDDTEVGTDEIDALDASATRAATISLTVPPTPRTYFYGACVKRKSGGTRCTAGIRVTVEETWVPPTNAGSVTSITGSTGKTTLTAHPNPGYDFWGWIKDGETLSTDTTYVAEATDAHEILAHFSVNQERGKWNVGQTYSWYRFPEDEYESLEWTFMFVADPPESLNEERLLHYYAYNFSLVNTEGIGPGFGYAGFQSDGHFRNIPKGKVINYAIWDSDGGKTDGLLEPNNPESGGYQIMYPFEWIEGQAYRFELREGPSGLDARGKWWGLWVEDVATGSVTFVGEQRMPTKINGRDATMWSPNTHVFGEDLHWWRASRGEYICSDFQPSSMVVLDVTAGANRDQPHVSYNVNSGEGRTWPNGRKTTNCHVTMFVNEQGDVQHNLGFWPDPPPNVVD